MTGEEIVVSSGDRNAWCHPLVVEPLREPRGVETQQPAPLQVRDPSLGDEAADVTHLHAQVLGHLSDVEQSWERDGIVIS